MKNRTKLIYLAFIGLAVFFLLFETQIDIQREIVPPDKTYYPLLVSGNFTTEEVEAFFKDHAGGPYPKWRGYIKDKFDLYSLAAMAKRCDVIKLVRWYYPEKMYQKEYAWLMQNEKESAARFLKNCIRSIEYNQKGYGKNP